MRDFLKRYKIRLETQGPVHIGSGEKLRKQEWILDRGAQEAIIIDTSKFFHLLNEKGLLQKYEAYVSQSRQPLHQWLKEQNVRPGDIRTFTAYRLDTVGFNLRNDKIKDMRMTVKDPYGMPYVPGSSLKGAIRNVVLAEMIRRKPADASDIKRGAAGKFDSRRYLGNEARALNEHYLHTKGVYTKEKSQAVNDAMSGIRISDSNSVGLDRLTLCQKIDVPTRGAEKELPLIRECIRPDTTFTFDLTIDETEAMGITADFIRTAITHFLDDYNGMFLRHFEDEHQYRGNVIYLGGGVGFPSKTVLNQALSGEPERERLKVTAQMMDKMFPKHKHRDDERKGVSPHTAKLTDIDGELLQMGPCSIEIVSV